MKVYEIVSPQNGAIPIGLGSVGKIRKGFPSTGSPEVDDSLDGSDLDKERKEFVDNKKSTLKK